MILQPPTYICPDHHTDLTSQVKTSLLVNDLHVGYAYGARAEGLIASLLTYVKEALSSHRDGREHKGEEPQPFEVVITCPGSDGAQQHKLTCIGTWTR